MNLVDTHCHIHDPKFGFSVDEVLKNAAHTGVGLMVCVGNDLDDSDTATEFVAKHEECVASVGIHPHEADRYAGDVEVRDKLDKLVMKPKVTAVGECGLDYYYNHSDAENQQALLRVHIECAIDHAKPLIFHVRDAFDDFWRVLDDYQGLSGVVHSFSASRRELDQVLDHGLYVGLNGIMTFSKDPEHLEVIKTVPEDRLVLETDAPFLTPVPKRGRINEPANVSLVCEYLAHVRSVSSESLATQTTNNAQRLFIY